MTKDKSVLLLSEAIGAGHRKAAEAIIKSLQNQDCQIKTLRVDAFRYVNRLLNKIMVGTYLEVLKFTPQVYGFLYARALAADDNSVALDFKNIVNAVISTRLRKLLSDFHPRVIVCTHAFPCGVISAMKSRGRVHAPIIGVITDFTIHPFWVYDNVDLYVVATEKLKTDLILKGIEPRKIASIGIPIDEDFAVPFDKAALRKNLGLPCDKKIVLVMGGGLGLGGFDEIIDVFREVDSGLYPVYVAGHNSNLLERLERAKRIHGAQMTVYGYTNRIAELMKASDLLITKPGGMTSAEALAVGLPMIIYQPIPGQEVKNSELLENIEAAIQVDDRKVLLRILNYLGRDPVKLKLMGLAASSKGKPNASIELARHIASLLNNHD